MSESVYRVDEITIVTRESHPPILTITCDGTAGTPGWTNIELSPYVYLIPPADGIQDFGLIGDPPTGIVTQNLTPVSCKRDWRAESSLKGIRVHAASNTLEELI